jgi:hypothetical protein
MESHFWLLTNLKFIFTVAVFGIEFLKKSACHDEIPVISIAGFRHTLE